MIDVLFRLLATISCHLSEEHELTLSKFSVTKICGWRVSDFYETGKVLHFSISILLYQSCSMVFQNRFVRSCEIKLTYLPIWSFNLPVWPTNEGCIYHAGKLHAKILHIAKNPLFFLGDFRECCIQMN